jgi:hypothetical protein
MESSSTLLKRRTRGLRAGIAGKATPTGGGLSRYKMATTPWVTALVALLVLAAAVLISPPDGPDGTANGRGWITSPAGAYVSDPTLAGRAVFTFEASREKSEGAPHGSVTFALGAADFAFNSVTCDSITVSNAAAWLVGRGTVNGHGDYGYRLIANDSTSKDGVAGLRFVIWDRASHAIVYDNQPTIPFGDQRALLASVGGGSIDIQAHSAHNANASTEQ